MWQHLFLTVLLLFVSSKCMICIGVDKLSVGQKLLANDALISKRNIYKLGFFRSGTSSNIYLGISYNNFGNEKKVWVANSDRPLSSHSSSKLELSDDGNLVLLDNLSNTPIWTTNLVSGLPNSTEAVLLDNGNFVLRNSLEPSTIYWQSFDHPTDTWLPGAKLGIDKLTGKTHRLTSWKNSEDPSPGRFSLEIDPNGTEQYFLEWNVSIRYWSSGVWNGEKFSLIPEMRENDFCNFSFVSNDRESYSAYYPYNTAILSRIELSPSGEIMLRTCLGNGWDWGIEWSQPRKQSKVYALCGAFGIFNETSSSSHCVCLPGFELRSTQEAGLDDWSGGCVRNTPLKCENVSSNGKDDEFLKFSNLTLPANPKTYPALNSRLCESVCRQNCSCTAYAYNGSVCSIWEGELLNLTHSDESDTKQDLYLKLAAADIPKAGGKRRRWWVILAIAFPLSGLFSAFFFWHLHWRNLKQKGNNKEVECHSVDLLSFDFDGSSSATDLETKAGNNLKTGKKDFDLPFFSFASVSAATGGFSSANKLGKGGFGPVYMGKLLSGQEIAVKRLAKRSGQGLEEFRNETVLIAKLQHRNLVRLLGCCIEQDEKILIYEYMSNKSLDFFLFDPNKQEKLNWKIRTHIIEGIAQGLLYLHQYSRLRIIHRDLKASNILLDSEMNPKISDFGMARIFGSNESQGNTNRIVGTYGYMAPEYAMEGLFSIKSDVYSFGVLLLEILSGKKNSGLYHINSLTLIGHAWDLWNADRSSELLDPVVDCPLSLMLSRYINIGLLCVQDNPAYRPTMSDVVTMLSNELAPLPTPKQPVFFTSRDVTVDTNSSHNSVGTGSVNGVTISTIQAR